MKDYCAFYGCLIPNRYPGIEASIRKTLPAIDINLVDVPEFSCCPAPGVFQSFNYKTWLTLAARNIAVAEEKGLDILTFCNGCYGSLFDANAIIQKEKGVREEINENLSKINMSVQGTINVEHIAIVLHEIVGIEKIKDVVKVPLGLNVASHSGCHLLRSETYKTLDDIEVPRLLDELVEALGCTAVDYDSKTQCCGAGGGVRTALPQISLQILHEKLRAIDPNAVDCLTDLCPFCHLQLDKGQVDLNAQYDFQYKIPVLYYLQLLGLAMGFSANEMGLNTHFTPTDPVVEKLSKLSEQELGNGMRNQEQEQDTNV